MSINTHIISHFLLCLTTFVSNIFTSFNIHLGFYKQKGTDDLPKYFKAFFWLIVYWSYLELDVEGNISMSRSVVSFIPPCSMFISNWHVLLNQHSIIEFNCVPENEYKWYICTLCNLKCLRTDTHHLALERTDLF